MASSSSSSLLFLLFLLGIPMALGHLACIPVIGPLLPCLPAFINLSEKPSNLCCTGTQVVAMEIDTFIEKEAACQCLNRVMKANPLITPENARNVTSQCNAVLPLPSKDGNCSTI